MAELVRVRPHLVRLLNSFDRLRRHGPSIAEGYGLDSCVRRVGEKIRNEEPVSVLRTAWLCAALLATTGSVAGASTINVQFYTQGAFYLEGNDPATTGTTSIGNPADSVGLSFIGVGTAGSPISVMSADSPFLQNLGRFTVSRGTNNNGNFDFDDDGYAFQLSIYQSVPFLGTGTLVGLLDGKIKQTARSTSAAISVRQSATSPTP